MMFCNAAYIDGLVYRNRTNSVYYDELANESIQSDNVECIESLHGAFASSLVCGNDHENMNSLEERTIWLDVTGSSMQWSGSSAIKTSRYFLIVI